MEGKLVKVRKLVSIVEEGQARGQDYHTGVLKRVNIMGMDISAV